MKYITTFNTTVTYVRRLEAKDQTYITGAVSGRTSLVPGLPCSSEKKEFVSELARSYYM